MIVSPPSILLVEDNLINQKLFTMLLEKFGHPVDIMSSGKEAIEILKTKRYHLIFMDCKMPDMDGYTTATTLRHMHITTPIIAMTANALKGDREKCLAAGMNDYLTKPIDPKMLITLLDKWINHPPILDMDRLLYIFSNDLPAIDTFLKNALASLGKLIKEIGDSIQDQDTSVNDLIHKLKGAASNSGMTQLYEISKKAEEKALQTDWNGLKKIYAQLEEAIIQLKIVLVMA